MNTDLRYLPFMKDEIVLVTSVKNNMFKKGTISLKNLDKLPFIMREESSGTFDIIKNTLRKSGLDPTKLKIEMQLGSTEAIKNYLLQSNAFAFLSVYGVRTELSPDKLQIIDIKDLKINRMLSFAQQVVFILILAFCLTPFINPPLALLLGLIVAQTIGHPCIFHLFSCV